MEPAPLTFESVSYRYPDGHAALCDVSFTLARGENTALLGVNGAGKSTLLLHTDGLLLPTSGAIRVDGLRIARDTLPEIRRRVGYLFQQPDDQLFMPTAGDDVAFGPANLRLPPDEIEARVTEALAAAGISELRNRAPGHLSVGQKKRVAIATILAMRPSILVMDEPTSALDPPARRQLTELIRGFGQTVLLATHDLALAGTLCTRTLILCGGRLIADGPTAELLADTALLAEAGLL